MGISDNPPCRVEFIETEGLLVARFADETEAVVYDAAHCTLAVVEVLQQQATDVTSR